MNKKKSKVYDVALAFQLPHIKRNETIYTPYPRTKISDCCVIENQPSYSEISRIIACNKSTISRELTRNKGKKGYRPKQAHEFARKRKANN